ncbi:hypothetical protein [Allonocardiopsis opalescens]|uniref:Uncharacterized protein n=1 Tax=Allonocardiopsis opalescens TaxID=1144618 RepID=A0A2T0QCG6_9ACTN|nr:hypothetical protein [Allonocardiopsis opalescens]PRY01560.1 hypothetical protein CLV72_101143 [Allonocardiopsis opalescens]
MGSDEFARRLIELLTAGAEGDRPGLTGLARRLDELLDAAGPGIGSGSPLPQGDPALADDAREAVRAVMTGPTVGTQLAGLAVLAHLLTARGAYAQVLAAGAWWADEAGTPPPRSGPQQDRIVLWWAADYRHQG